MRAYQIILTFLILAAGITLALGCTQQVTPTPTPVIEVSPEPTLIPGKEITPTPLGTEIPARPTVTEPAATATVITKPSPVKTVIPTPVPTATPVPSPVMSPTPTPTPTPAPTPTPTPVPTPPPSPSYMQGIDSALQRGPVFILFGAPWCQYCNEEKPIVNELSQEYRGISFQEINVDESKDIAKAFGVSMIPQMNIIVKRNPDGSYVYVTSGGGTTTDRGGSKILGFKTKDQLKPLLDAAMNAR